jgi:uncharacterized membrane-anchored protein
MSARSIKRVLVAMAVADLLVFGGWVASEELHRGGAAIKLPVEGYDPRDLLSGHYVRFRLIAAREATPFASPSEQRFAVCLEATEDGLYHVTRLRRRGDACAPFLSGTGAGGLIDFGVDRFYVDERIAGEVRWVRPGPNTYLVATVDGNGVVHPIDLVVDGNSLKPRR